VADPPSLIL